MASKTKAGKQRPSHVAKPIKKDAAKKEPAKKVEAVEEAPPARTRTPMSPVTMRRLNAPKDAEIPSVPAVPAKHVMTEKEALVQSLKDGLPEGREERWVVVEQQMVAVVNSTMTSGIALLSLQAEMPQGEFVAELARRGLPQRTCYNVMRIARTFGGGHERLRELGTRKLLVLAAEGFTKDDYDPVSDTVAGHPVDEIEKIPSGQVRDMLRKSKAQISKLNQQLAQAETKIAELDAVARPMPGNFKTALKISTQIKNTLVPSIRGALNIDWEDEKDERVVDEVAGAVALAMGACYEILHKVIYACPGAQGGMGAGIRVVTESEFITMLRICGLPVAECDEDKDVGDMFADRAKERIAQDAWSRVEHKKEREERAEEDHERLVFDQSADMNGDVIDVSAN